MVYLQMISTQQNQDETLVQFKLLTMKKVMCIIVIKIDYTDKLKVNQIKYTVNH